MDGFDPAESFGPDVAARYRDHVRGDEAETVDLLVSLAGGRSACELAIGTGRIAVPLAARGVEVHGIELSQAMLDQLPDQPGISAVRGDMSGDDPPGGPYGLVYLVYNTIGNLLTQQRQVDVFRNAARHLLVDGVFLVECLTPWHGVPGRQFVNAEYVGGGSVVLDVNRYDPATQLLSENHVTLSAAGIRMGPIEQRLVSPAELDLMAQVAGLRLLDRWGGWLREPFTGDSRRHVSVYGR